MAKKKAAKKSAKSTKKKQPAKATEVLDAAVAAPVVDPLGCCQYQSASGQIVRDDDVRQSECQKIPGPYSPRVHVDCIQFENSRANEEGSMRIVVVINKWWECEPAIAAMLNSNAWPSPTTPWPATLNSPLQRPAGKTTPFLSSRAVFRYTNFEVDMWCVSDLLNDVEANCQSSSSLKAALLPQIFAGAPAPDLLIAVGTASSAAESPNRNGGVAIGTAVFLHNAHPDGENPLSTWEGPSDELITSSITPKLFGHVASFDAASALLHFLPLKRNTSDAPVVTAGFGDVALGSLNVTNYGHYKYKDPETVAAYAASGNPGRPVSVETTHGLIRLSCPEAPFMFLSTITDRFTYFDADVSGIPLNDAQNTAAAYNAGIALRWMFANLDTAISAPTAKPCVPPNRI